ncbi:MAG: hypothetical protein WBZ01_17835 [Terriglobales bacterium]|jgi:hypothetical protein
METVSIPLGDHWVAIIDAADFAAVDKHRWYYHPVDLYGHRYAYRHVRLPPDRGSGWSSERLECFILGINLSQVPTGDWPGSPPYIRFKDGNPLNCTRVNLEVR